MVSDQKARLSSRPNTGRNLGSDVTGLRRTGLDTDRDGILYVPASFNPKKQSPLIVMLHGAGGNAHHAIDPMRDLADHTGTILLAPESQGQTWDVILGGFGKDIHFIDEALGDAFALYRVDPARIAIGGFSDGASYALSVGLTNADLFTHVIAFSPGFSAEATVRGAPGIFISHGTEDQVLPIEQSSRNLVRRLKAKGLEINYREFEGGHTIPPEIGREAFNWFLGASYRSQIATAAVPAHEAGIEST